jgi:putative transposase
MVTACVRRRHVVYAHGRGLSVRKACRLFSVSRSSVGYESKLRSRDAPVLGTMRELALRYPRYGYRRIRIFLGRAGHAMSPGRAHRIWRAEGRHQRSDVHRALLQREPRFHL